MTSPLDVAQACGVTFDGRHYRYGSYRYDREGDAVAYSELEQAREGVRWTAPPAASPSADPLRYYDADAARPYGIRFDGRTFRYGEYRYDRFEDAVAYAELKGAGGGRHPFT